MGWTDDTYQPDDLPSLKTEWNEREISLSKTQELRERLFVAGRTRQFKVAIPDQFAVLN